MVIPFLGCKQSNPGPAVVAQHTCTLFYFKVYKNIL